MNITEPILDALKKAVDEAGNPSRFAKKLPGIKQTTVRNWLQGITMSIPEENWEKVYPLLERWLRSPPINILNIRAGNMESGINVLCQKCGSDNLSVEPLGDRFAVICGNGGGNGPLGNSRAEALAAFGSENRAAVRKLIEALGKLTRRLEALRSAAQAARTILGNIDLGNASDAAAGSAFQLLDRALEAESEQAATYRDEEE